MICLLEYEKGVYHSSACLSPDYRQVTLSPTSKEQFTPSGREPSVCLSSEMNIGGIQRKRTRAKSSISILIYFYLSDFKF
ncbi:hypothetical protein IMSAGC014_00317 [Bacteroidaceae bacterium]|nr:hypothetical protein IMSAGC014_00317 [Bacteroidaceae bacterium]